MSVTARLEPRGGDSAKFPTRMPLTAAARANSGTPHRERPGQFSDPGKFSGEPLENRRAFPHIRLRDWEGELQQELQNLSPWLLILESFKTIKRQGNTLQLFKLPSTAFSKRHTENSIVHNECVMPNLNLWQIPQETKSFFLIKWQLANIWTIQRELDTHTKVNRQLLPRITR